MRKVIIYDWVIYKIENPAGAIYIGKTNNFKKRISYYKNGNYNRQLKLAASLNKYGFEYHLISIIDELQGDNNLCNEKEIFWIGYYKSNCCKYKDGNGLNLTDGGGGTIGYKASDELKKRLSEAHLGLPSPKKGKFFSAIEAEKRARRLIPKTERPKRKRFLHKEEAKIKMSLAKKGRVAHNKGKPMPLHQLEILRKINTGRPSCNKGKKFEGTDEERKVKFGSHNIGNSYNKGRKHKSGYGEAMSLIRKGKPNIKKRKAVFQYTLGGEFIKEYDSIKNASEETGLSKWTIGTIANGRMKILNKFIFKFKRA